MCSFLQRDRFCSLSILAKKAGQAEGSPDAVARGVRVGVGRLRKGRQPRLRVGRRARSGNAQRERGLGGGDATRTSRLKAGERFSGEERGEVITSRALAQPYKRLETARCSAVPYRLLPPLLTQAEGAPPDDANGRHNGASFRIPHFQFHPHGGRDKRKGVLVLA